MFQPMIEILDPNTVRVDVTEADVTEADGSPVDDTTARSGGPTALRDPPRGSVLPQLLRSLADLGSELDTDQLLERICVTSREFTSCSAAAFAIVSDGKARVIAASGITDLSGRSFPVTEAGLRALTDSGRWEIGNLEGLAGHGDALFDAGRNRSMVVSRVIGRDGAVGALLALYSDARHELSGEDKGVLDLLAACSTVALGNAIAVEHAVREQAHWAAVIDAIADGVAVLDASARVTAWNLAAARLLGIPASEAIGKPFPLSLGLPGEPLERRLDEHTWVELTATPMDGGSVVAIHDVSRQRALDAAKTMFVASTGHELKTPLTVIRSFAEWLRDRSDEAEPEQRDKALTAIADSAEELRQLVEKILLTARTEAGAVDLDVEVIAAPRLVRAVAEQFGAVGNGHRLVVDVPAALPDVVADRGAVRTVLGQLLENAFKYSPDGGEVTVRARAVEDGVEIVVQDQGIGLEPDEVPFLFAAFYQGSSRERSGARGGVGLGLSIVRRLVEAMNGRVGASGAPGAGARFWFTLPAAPSPMEHDSDMA